MSLHTTGSMLHIHTHRGVRNNTSVVILLEYRPKEQSQPHIPFNGSSAYNEDFPWRDVPVHAHHDCDAALLPNPAPGVTGHMFYLKEKDHWAPLPSPSKK